MSGWLSWEGDFSESDLEAESIWDRVGAEPISIVLAEGTCLTVRADVVRDAESDVTEVAFLGNDDSVAVFTEVGDLARYCRVATDHRLRKLEWWSELGEVADDELFTPLDEATYDLRSPSSRGAELLRELIIFCDLSEIDVSILDGDRVDKDDWRSVVDEVKGCLKPQD